MDEPTRILTPAQAQAMEQAAQMDTRTLAVVRGVIEARLNEARTTLTSFTRDIVRNTPGNRRRLAITIDTLERIAHDVDRLKDLSQKGALTR